MVLSWGKGSGPLYIHLPSLGGAAKQRGCGWGESSLFSPDNSPRGPGGQGWGCQQLEASVVAGRWSWQHSVPPMRGAGQPPKPGTSQTEPQPGEQVQGSRYRVAGPNLPVTLCVPPLHPISSTHSCLHHAGYCASLQGRCWLHRRASGTHCSSHCDGGDNKAAMTGVRWQEGRHSLVPRLRQE